jgi:uncharacterized RDD family membrane protein YckC
MLFSAKEVSYQTSEKVNVHFEIADIWSRFAAFVIDFVFQIVVVAVLFVLFLSSLWGGGGLNLTEDGSIRSPLFFTIEMICILVLILIVFFYQMLFELFTKGQTPGKRFLHLRVVSERGTPAPAGSIILRNLFRIVDFLPVFYIAGGIVTLLNTQNRRLGDLVAGTVVVREEDLPKPYYSAEPGKRELFSNVEVNHIFSKKERQLFAEYITNRANFASQAQSKIEARLVSMIENKSGVAKPETMNNIDFILNLYHHKGE